MDYFFHRLDSAGMYFTRSMPDTVPTMSASVKLNTCGTSAPVTTEYTFTPTKVITAMPDHSGSRDVFCIMRSKIMPSMNPIEIQQSNARMISYVITIVM